MKGIKAALEMNAEIGKQKMFITLNLLAARFRFLTEISAISPDLVLFDAVHLRERAGFKYKNWTIYFKQDIIGIWGFHSAKAEVNGDVVDFIYPSGDAVRRMISSILF